MVSICECLLHYMLLGACKSCFSECQTWWSTWQMLLLHAPHRNQMAAHVMCSEDDSTPDLTPVEQPTRANGRKKKAELDHITVEYLRNHHYFDMPLAVSGSAWNFSWCSNCLQGSNVRLCKLYSTAFVGSS